MGNLHVLTHPEATHHVDGLAGEWFGSGLTETPHNRHTQAGALVLPRTLNSLSRTSTVPDGAEPARPGRAAWTRWRSCVAGCGLWPGPDLVNVTVIGYPAQSARLTGSSGADATLWLATPLAGSGYVRLFAGQAWSASKRRPWPYEWQWPQPQPSPGDLP
ncbi:MAG: hypothetical protein QOJ50_3766 [Cryptosporangiaceae bacterium]|nr:hypothetical protein [Cryptosporangiaceae bacterium]